MAPRARLALTSTLCLAAVLSGAEASFPQPRKAASDPQVHRVEVPTGRHLDAVG